jgi:hypothetical protein
LIAVIVSAIQLGAELKSDEDELETEDMAETLDQGHSSGRALTKANL